MINNSTSLDKAQGLKKDQDEMIDNFWQGNKVATSEFIEEIGESNAQIFAAGREERHANSLKIAEEWWNGKTEQERRTFRSRWGLGLGISAMYAKRQVDHQRAYDAISGGRKI